MNMPLSFWCPWNRDQGIRTPSQEVRNSSECIDRQLYQRLSFLRFTNKAPAKPFPRPLAQAESMLLTSKQKRHAGRPSPDRTARPPEQMPDDGRRNETDGSPHYETGGFCRTWGFDPACRGPLRLPRCSAPDAATGDLPTSTAMLGLVLKILAHCSKSTDLVCTLARNQQLYRVRLEALVQNRDISRQSIDEHVCRI